MSKDMTRSEAIYEIKRMIKVHEFMQTVKDKRVSDAFLARKLRALQIALESLEIDEKYQLEYENIKEAADDQIDNSNPCI